jgi:hypothetical protein
MSMAGLRGLPEPRRVAVYAGAIIALFALLGAVHLLAPSAELSRFSLDGERTVPAAFSAVLLLAAGVLAWRVGAAGGDGFGSQGVWRFMGGFLVFMAFDELLAIHEHFQRRKLELAGSSSMCLSHYRP